MMASEGGLWSVFEEMVVVEGSKGTVELTHEILACGCFRDRSMWRCRWKMSATSSQSGIPLSRRIDAKEIILSRGTGQAVSSDVCRLDLNRIQGSRLSISLYCLFTLYPVS